MRASMYYVVQPLMRRDFGLRALDGLLCCAR